VESGAKIRYIRVIGGFFIFKKIPAHCCALSTVVIPSFALIRVIRGLFCLYALALILPCPFIYMHCFYE
jgi:hypothetical protein